MRACRRPIPTMWRGGGLDGQMRLSDDERRIEQELWGRHGEQMDEDGKIAGAIAG